MRVLREDGEFVLLRARGDESPSLASPNSHPGGPASILVLAPLAEPTSARSLRRLEHELALAPELDPAWAVRPLTLTRHEGRPVLLLEDPGGEPLQSRIGQPCDLADFLALAIAVTHALAQAHGRGLIHKDLKPANILVTAGLEVFLTGFGLASLSARDGRVLPSVEVSAGTLPYMSPEQTGRMDRGVDSRSDLYSLGITLFELLTGKLPFVASEPLDWVHCHIARRPISALEYRPSVPEPLARILLKLLAKSAEERYQTAGGLEADWRHCLEQLERQGHVELFALGEHDAPDRLIAPELIYGRERELAALESAYEEVVRLGMPVFMLVRGYAGVGKSALVQEFHRKLARLPGRYAAGKCDPYRREIPYTTLMTAFSGLVHQLLGLPAGEIAQWRTRLLEALGGSGQLIVDLAPELALIIGPQAAVPEAPPQDVLNRFRRVIRRFVGVFASPEQPLVLFLDDLQWLDPATLDLLAHLLTEPDVRHVLVIGAYRDNEIDAAHPLAESLQSLRAWSARIEEVVLTSLTRADTEQLVSVALHSPHRRVAELAALVHLKTGGNPFFAIQFLTNLEQEGLLRWRGGAEGWRWDLGRIRAKGFTDNVAHLLVARLTRLSPRVLAALQRLACLGGVAEARILARALEIPEPRVYEVLGEAILVGLVIRSDDCYRVLHDRIWEAAYSLVSEQDRPALHLRIGRALWETMSAAEVQENIFTIVNQLNRGRDLITEERTRQDLAGLNLLAAQRARQTSAWAAALQFANTGRELLPRDGWSRCPELAFALEFHRGECEFLTGDLEGAGSHLAALAERASTPAQGSAVTCLRETIHENLGQIQHSVRVCLEYLRQQGLDLPLVPVERQVQEEYADLWRQLGARAVEDLRDLPLLTDPSQRAVLDVLAALLPPAFLTGNATLVRLVIVRMANISLQHGNSDASAFAYSYLNFVVGAELGDYALGFRFGKLAVDLLERGFRRFKARVELMFGATVLPWTQPLRGAALWARRSLESAQEGGDLTFACYSWFMLFPYRLCGGEPLDEVQREAERALEFARRQRSFMLELILPQVAFLRALRGTTPEVSCFTTAEFDETAYEKRLAEDPGLDDRVCWYWLRKLQAYFHAENYEAALTAAPKTRSQPWRTATLPYIRSDYHFFAALAHAARFEAAPPPQRVAHREELAAHVRSLSELAVHSAENFGSRACLLAAELARIERRDPDAHRLYEQAIAAARDQGYVHDEAVALELAGRFYESRALDTVALDLLRRAHSCYERWGALAKVRLLERRYPKLFDRLARSSAAVGGSTEDLETASVIKAAQAVSGEIVLDSLIHTLLSLAVKEAGAERGLLILIRDGKARLAAHATLDQEQTGGNAIAVTVEQTEISAQDLPSSILHYVIRTQESVILDDARRSHPFPADPYFSGAGGAGHQHGPRAVLCKPLIRQSRLIGVLYLENKIASGVFTPARTAVLDVLAAQAAISLENAWLYSDLQERESRIRRLIDSNVVGIFFWSMTGEIVEANEAFLRLVGYTREDLLRGELTWQRMTPAEYHELDRLGTEQILSEGIVSPHERELSHRDGQHVPVLLGSTFLEGTRERGVSFVLDLTERRQAEQERSARRVAEAANRAKSEFLATMSHELRTPLNAILGYAQILGRDLTLSPRQRDRLGIIQHSGEHLLTLIDEVLDVAKIEAGRLSLELSEVPLTSFLTTLHDIILVKAQEKRLGLTWNIAPGLPQGVLADERRLRQVLLNLLANAVKFTDHGRVCLSVTSSRPAHLCFEVSDTGVGIGADQLQHLFQPFEQVGDARQRAGGTGLGLAISRRLVRLMGGDIQVRSQLGGGSTFCFELELPVIGIEARPSGPVPVISGYSGPRRSVLVVDDEPQNRALLVDLLQPLGFTVMEASNGRESLEKSCAMRPDLVITDLVMPEMDGREATRRMRAVAELAQVPVIFVSADTSAGPETNTSAAEPFLSKPIDTEELLRTIAAQLDLQWTH